MQHSQLQTTVLTCMSSVLSTLCQRATVMSSRFWCFPGKVCFF